MGMVEAEHIRTEIPKKREIWPFLIHRLKTESRNFMIIWSVLKILLFIWIISLFFNYLLFFSHLYYIIIEQTAEVWYNVNPPNGWRETRNPKPEIRNKSK